MDLSSLRSLVPAAALIGFASTPASVVGQVARGPVDTTAVVTDSSDLVSVGRAAQALFERRRERYLPLTFAGGSGPCDEHVGRFCTWYGEGEWYPGPEAEEIVELRAELLAQLDELQGLLPGDGWLLGQRVWYRSEGGDWRGALHAARSCGSVERGWCRALEGLALHGLGRDREAESAFGEALALMDPERARAWRVPERAVDPDVRDLLEDAERVGPDSARAVLDRLWTMADPLYLVDGNDRLTAHYARWTVATLRERARNPFRIRWGDDMEELTIRHGWELGWERSPARGIESLHQVIGHKHPQGREFMPSGSALREPYQAAPSELDAGHARPRSLHAPQYAPVLLPMEGQIAVFPRARETVIVSTQYLPEDTTLHADHDHGLPYLEPGAQAELPDRVGLFAVSLGTGEMHRHVRTGSVDGALALRVPPGAYLVSAETWSPPGRRAGRRRLGLAERAAPEDVATLSDMLLLRPLADEPTVLEAALDAALPRARIRPGQSFAIAWEVAGLGFRPETLLYEVSVTRDGVNVLRRIGQILRLADRPQPLVLSWEEPGPEVPGQLFRYLDLDLPALDPGRYEIRLTLRTTGRSDAVATRAFEVVERG